MANVLYVALGGALGSVLRYLLGLGLNGAFPYGTLAVNIIGCFVMGLLAGYGGLVGETPAFARYFLMVGVLGGFTTFSAFSLDVLLMVERGQPLLATGYIGLSVLLSLFAVFAGVWLVKALT